MSEEILKALMQLFAIITKQDEGTSDNEKKFVEAFLRQQLNENTVIEYLKLYDEFGASKNSEKEKEKEGGEETGEKKKKLTSVKDSVRTLVICKKINKTLSQKQKIVVLVRLYELINSDKKFTDQRMAIIRTVADAFNIEKDEFKNIENFVLSNDVAKLDNPEILLVNDLEASTCEHCRQIKSDHLDGNIIILRVKSVELYFLRYTGANSIYLNGLAVSNHSIYLFANGSSIKVPSGRPIFYSDIVSHFMTDDSSVKLSFNVKNVEYRFPNGNLGLRNITISEGSGKLIGIMGASGAGKTTLLNLMAGHEKPYGGEVLINGINIHTDKQKIKGVIGYVPQDDLLVEELSVFENLFYNAKLCFKDMDEEDLTLLVVNVLTNLGLNEIKHLKVGSPLDKKISGGQRKRLNIALELIREPSVLFLDEPTSGLSSRDSENVMDLLRELTMKGKLIFVVIHQPSSDIYKMFDKLIFLDVGGFMIYYGNPVEALIHFKTIDKQINSNQGSCPECGNVNPEIIFNIIEAKVVDEYGKFTHTRKTLPHQWNDIYEKTKTSVQLEDVTEAPPLTLSIPSRIKQFFIFSARDMASKLSNTQYLLINLLEAPLLAFILSFIIRYIADPKSDVYIFRSNENIPAYIFMSIIVFLFIGLTVSAEEIFRDRKILKRESLLDLSRSSYLFSKLGILFLLSAVQSLLFVWVGNSIIGVKGMFVEYWMVLFSVSCFANVLGLNISAAFNSAVTIYIIIPLLIIPQMILGGAMFSFDKINEKIGGGNRVPLIADIMASRWAYEALMVNQYKNNEYGRLYYDVEKKESYANYKQALYIPELKMIISESVDLQKVNSDSAKNALQQNLGLLKNELAKESKIMKDIHFKHLNSLNVQQFSPAIADSTNAYLDSLQSFYTISFNLISINKDQLTRSLQDTPEKKAELDRKFDTYYNENLSDILKKTLNTIKIEREGDQLVQVIDPIFQNPSKNAFLGFRTHFYAPLKRLGSISMDTLLFNTLFIWFLSTLLYFALYYDLLRKMLAISDKMRLLDRLKLKKDKKKLPAAAEEALQENIEKLEV